MPTVGTDVQPANKRSGVAHIAYSLKTGGMERLLAEFARNSSFPKYNLHFFSLTDGGPLAAELESHGARVIQLKKRPGFRWSVVLRLASAFRRNGIRVVHTHNSGAMIYGALASRIAGIRCVIHTRHGQRTGSDKHQTFIFSGVSRLIDCVVGVSHDSTAMSVAEGVPASRTRTIWNGIDLDRFPFFGANGSGAAIMVARLAPEKDVETLVRAVAIAIRTAPKFRLDIVGDGPCRQKLQTMVDELALHRSVRLLGERSDIPGLLQSASMFALPSRSEGLSLTLLEAMATGLPVIATAVGGNPEVVIDGQTGLMTSDGDPQKLANAMVQIASDPSSAYAMGRNGRARVEQHFDVKSMICAYEALYEEVLTTNHRKSRMALFPQRQSTRHAEVWSAAAGTSR